MSYTAETGYVGLAIQSVQGTFQSPTDYMRVKSVDLNPEGDKIIPDPEIGGISDITDVHQGTYKISGTIDSYVRPEAIGVLFKAALGEYTASGEVDTGAYLHNMTPASGALPWLSIQKSISDNVEVYNYTDCKVNGFALELNASELASIGFEIVGIKDVEGVAAIPSYETAPLLVATKATLNLNGVAISAKSCNVDYKNNLDGDDFRVGSRFLGDITEKRRELDISMEIVLNTTSELYKKAFYGSASASEAGFDVYAESLDIILDSPTNIADTDVSYKILLQIKNAVFMAAPTPASGDDLVVIPLELKATKQTGYNLMEVHIWNGKSTYDV